MAVRHLLSIADLKPSDIEQITRRSVEIGSKDFQETKSLEGKAVGIYFRKTSTRTRTSFTVGAARLGAITISYGPSDLQTNTGETIDDTGKVLSGFLDGLVIRTAESIAEMKALAAQDRMAVINAMSDNEHPTQALADLGTLTEHFGNLNNLKVLYMGEGNNTASALALAFARIPGAQLTILSPRGYVLDQNVIDRARKWADLYGANIQQHHTLDELREKVDVVYTTRWQTTGTTKSDPNWLKDFTPFKVTKDLFDRLSTSRTVFMHDLPAVRYQEVDAEVLEGSKSIVFRQARYKLFSAMAVLEWCILGQ
jgi:ornithine carbamoyltransferase